MTLTTRKVAIGRTSSTLGVLVSESSGPPLYLSQKYPQNSWFVSHTLNYQLLTSNSLPSVRRCTSTIATALTVLEMSAQVSVDNHIISEPTNLPNGQSPGTSFLLNSAHAVPPGSGKRLPSYIPYSSANCPAKYLLSQRKHAIHVGWTPHMNQRGRSTRFRPNIRLLNINLLRTN